MACFVVFRPQSHLRVVTGFVLGENQNQEQGRFGSGMITSRVKWEANLSNPIIIGSVRGSPNGTIGNFTNGTIGSVISDRSH